MRAPVGESRHRLPHRHRPEPRAGARRDARTPPPPHARPPRASLSISTTAPTSGKGRERSRHRWTACCRSAHLAVGTEEELPPPATDDGGQRRRGEPMLASGIEALVLKRGAQERDGVPRAMPRRSTSRRSAIDVLNVLGAGDAFASGLLYGYLQGWPLSARGPAGQRDRRDRRHSARLRQLHADARRSRGIRRRSREDGSANAPPDPSDEAQAVVRFLSQQRTARDGRNSRSSRGVLGIFGHGNVAGIGEALQAARAALRVLPARATSRRWCTPRPPTRRCETGCRPSRARPRSAPARRTWSPARRARRSTALPVLLLPGDIFASRRPAPVLQQLESSQSQDSR